MLTSPPVRALLCSRWHATPGRRTNFRIFHVQAGKTVSISGLTIANGNASGASPADEGGGILNEGNLTLSNVAVSQNHAAGLGGGVESISGSLTLINTTVDSNTCDGPVAGVDQTGGTLHH